MACRFKGSEPLMVSDRDRLRGSSYTMTRAICPSGFLPEVFPRFLSQSAKHYSEQIRMTACAEKKQLQFFLFNPIHQDPVRLYVALAKP